MMYQNQTVQVPVEDPQWYKGSFQLRAGVLLVAEVATVSFISVAGLLTVVAVRMVKRWRRKRVGHVLAEDEPTQPVALLFVLTMCMELVQAFANVMNVRWSWQGAATEGTYCTTQAVLKQVGDDGAALFTMFLAIMTLIPTIWPTALSPAVGRRIVHGMIAFVVLFLLLMITIPATTLDNYYGPTGPWCWIPTKVHGKRIMKNAMMGILAQYAWFWLASATCFLCYGYIVILWWKEADGDNELRKQAIVMMWYPIAYFIEIFPLSVTRITQLQNLLKGKPTPPPGFTIFAAVLFASSGWVNVVLWVVTGRQFGFTAASVRPVHIEPYRDPVEVAPARDSQISKRRPPPQWFEPQDQRESGDEKTFTPLQPAFPPLHASEPWGVAISSGPTSPHPNYGTPMYQLGAHSPDDRPWP